MKKRKKIEKERISFEIPLEDLKKIDAIAEKSSRSRSDMIRILLGMGLDDAILLQKIGFLTAINYGLNIFDKFKEALEKGDVKIDDGNANFPIYEE